MPERTAPQRLGKPGAQGVVGRGEREGRRQPARHVGREARPRQHGECRLRQGLGQHLHQELAGGLLQALGADDDGLGSAPDAAPRRRPWRARVALAPP